MSQPGFDPAIVVGASEAQATAADPSASLSFLLSAFAV